jgi:hypothetical protein
MSDGMRVYLDGDLIVDRWRDQAPVTWKTPRTLSQGSHLITVEYYERTGGATAQLIWESGSPVIPGPVISSFTAAPASTAPGHAVTLSWQVSGATSIGIDNGVGDVTGRSTTTVVPVQTTTYTLTASNGAGVSTATAKVTVSATTDTQAPTPPVLVSATARSGTQVDLVWTASSDNIAVTRYEILRNNTLVGSVPASALTYTDSSLNPGSTYTYSVKAFDAAGNSSSVSNAVQVTTPAVLPEVSVTWHGACWQYATLHGVTGYFQAMDFVLKTSTPVPVQATLFFGPNCDPMHGTDNMNDFNELTGSTHMVRGFVWHPNEMPTSAFFWVGSRTIDGRCAPGSPCSGCVNYTSTTPNCSTLP